MTRDESLRLKWESLTEEERDSFRAKYQDKDEYPETEYGNLLAEHLKGKGSMTRDEAILTVELMKTGVKLNEAGCDRLLSYLHGSTSAPSRLKVNRDEALELLVKLIERVPLDAETGFVDSVAAELYMDIRSYIEKSMPSPSITVIDEEGELYVGVNGQPYHHEPFIALSNAEAERDALIAALNNHNQPQESSDDTE